MSSVAESMGLDADESEVCEFCGLVIETPDQDCPALFIGRCDAC